MARKQEQLLSQLLRQMSETKRREVIEEVVVEVLLESGDEGPSRLEFEGYTKRGEAVFILDLDDVDRFAVDLNCTLLELHVAILNAIEAFVAVDTADEWGVRNLALDEEPTTDTLEKSQVAAD